MTTISLDTLPEELIGLIAVHGDALSALRLSQTCRRARSACYNGAIFKDILTASQINKWAKDTLCIEAVASRAEGGVSVWARYAVADQKAWHLAEDHLPFFEELRAFLIWLPELFAINHPCLYHPRWKRFLLDPQSMSSREVYCLAFSILGIEESMLEVQRSLDLEELHPSLLPNESSGSYPWALCISALIIRNQLYRRLRAWPFNNAALVPYISIPQPIDIIKPGTGCSRLPLPFSQAEQNACSWDCWLTSLAYENMNSCDAVIGTSWQGYYIHLYREDMLDPPMVNITFESVPKSSQSGPGTMVEARNCRDGIGSFEINGRFSNDEDTISFRGRKEYGSWGFEWKLVMGAFGLVGFWGDVDAGGFHKDGLVWLWKVGE